MFNFRFALIELSEIKIIKEHCTQMTDLKKSNFKLSFYFSQKNSKVCTVNATIFPVAFAHYHRPLPFPPSHPSIHTKQKDHLFVSAVYSLISSGLQTIEEHTVVQLEG